MQCEKEVPTTKKAPKSIRIANKMLCKVGNEMVSLPSKSIISHQVVAISNNFLKFIEYFFQWLIRFEQLKIWSAYNFFVYGLSEK